MANDQRIDMLEDCTVQNAIIDQLREDKKKDEYRLDWLEEKASKGQIQIAKSLLGTGYEVAICRKGGMTTVDVYGGSFRDAIDSAMGDYA